jgi:hypothetical protein
MYDRRMKWVVEPGQFDVWVGQSSVGGQQGALEVTPGPGAPAL